MPALAAAPCCDPWLFADDPDCARVTFSSRDLDGSGSSVMRNNHRTVISNVVGRERCGNGAGALADERAPVGPAAGQREGGPMVPRPGDRTGP